MAKYWSKKLLKRIGWFLLLIVVVMTYLGLLLFTIHYIKYFLEWTVPILLGEIVIAWVLASAGEDCYHNAIGKNHDKSDDCEHDNPPVRIYFERNEETEVSFYKNSSTPHLIEMVIKKDGNTIHHRLEIETDWMEKMIEINISSPTGENICLRWNKDNKEWHEYVKVEEA